MVIEIYAGVAPVDAFISMLINWFIQIIFEQANNYVIFYLREKKNIFSSTFTDDKNGNDASTTTTKDQGVECKSATLPMVYRGTMSLLNDTVWFAFLAMPYVCSAV